MQSSRELRERAVRYLVLASIARHRGDIGLAGVLTERAQRLLEDAYAAEAAQPNVQQQQQIQPKGDNA